MIHVGIGISAAKDHIRAVKEALTEAKVNLRRERPDLAIVFSSAEYAHPVVAKTIIMAVGISHLAIWYFLVFVRILFIIVLSLCHLRPDRRSSIWIRLRGNDRWCG